LRNRFIVKPGRRFRLDKVDPDHTGDYKRRKDAEKRLKKNVKRMSELQYLLYAENKRCLLIVLQAMDAGGKDGTIRHVMAGVNPQGCRVTSFKVPSAEEADHDFLWRIHRAVPPKGEIGIFNRSHYEDVLVVRVHQLVPEKVWRARYEQINAFERLLADNGIVILKFYLHISKDEQKERFQSRLDNENKHWKISRADYEERRFWDDYMKAYEDVLSKCSTSYAPWFVIPSNTKWFRNLVVSEIIADTLESLDMQFPEPTEDISKISLE